MNPLWMPTFYTPEYFHRNPPKLEIVTEVWGDMERWIGIRR
ncbi:MAG: hypothetical protein RLZZ505_622 [Verrucomicrobiota bacterium]|jgi:hypothetical protein